MADAGPRRISRRSALAALGAAGCSARGQILLRGAGATIPSAQYEVWFAAFSAAVPRVTVDYAPLGSGAGLRQLRAEEVDFGASDVGIPPEARATFAGPMLVLPIAMSAVCIAFNLPELEGQLRLRREVVARMFLGDIRSWDDAAIAEDNPGVVLPRRPVTPVGRADGGGSTAIFSRGLAAASAAWRSAVGVGLAVTEPHAVNARGSDGVAALLSRLPGAVGYVEVARAVQASLRVALVDDEAGAFLGPTQEAVLLAGEDLSRAGDLFALPRAGFPFASPTFLVVPEEVPDVARGAALARLLHWLLDEGQASLRGHTTTPGAPANTLAPLPDVVLDQARADVRRMRSGRTNLLSID